ncbi:DUF4388 domain-containing protein [Candidatus Obscuribacterales bacterium]|nr:DUF4388 domain-containing protein [Candidatus Obscuribacterales bacterium]MBX3137219.1 DUF4388 domain-containing protein [Candidatus Obscuribacterales bacterium]MBX3152492.1 DUF4388 domain-containing protein [Candidatus Obscuribacterales bacterium]
MFRSNQHKELSASRRSQSTSSLKLPQLWVVPTLENVISMLSMANKDQGRVIEQYWSVEGQDRLLNLRVSCDDTGDPCWTLSASNMMDTSTLWQHRTIDTGLIHNLIFAESTGDISANSTSNGGLSGGSSITLGVTTEDSTAATKGSTRSFKLQQESENEAEAVLQGDIAKVQLPTVLQSIQMGQMTGRLAVRSEGRGVDVYFDEGEPVHASDGVDTGADVILDMITLNVGKFRFIPDERTVERSINRRLDGLIMEAVTLVDQSTYLDQQGLTGDAYLITRNPNLTLEEFTQIVSGGAPVDEMLQRQLYREVGDYKTLLDLLRSKPLKRSEWVPIIFNLVTLNLLGVSDKPPQQRKQTQLLDAQVDIKTLEQVLKPCMRPETGVLTYPAFQYFVAQECFRYELCGMPLSVVVFSIRRKSDGNAADLSAVKEIMSVIHSLKRPIDMIGHFQMFDYGVVLPNTGTRSAAVFAQKVQESLAQLPAAQNVVMCFGIAGIPENCKTMGQLLSAASEAKKHAESSASPVILYQNIQGL